MKCMYCGFTESKVIDSRSADDEKTIRRRRECTGCGRRFTTYETIEIAPILVIKSDGARQAFDMGKIKRGIIKACEKRPVALGDIEKLVGSIETSVCQQPEQEVTTDQIGLLVMDGLKSLDEVAYIRFASVYRQFKDVQSFMQELQQLLDHQKKPEE